MSFFDDDEETTPRSSRNPVRPRSATRAGAGRTRPRSTQSARGSGGGQNHDLMVRRRIAAGIAVVLLIVVVLLIDGCVKSQKISSLKEYNREVAAIAHESDTAVSEPLFSALTDSASKSALEVDGQINQLRLKAQELASRTHGLSVPGEMEGAQRAFLMAMNLREEGMNKLDQHVSQALGGQAKQASALIAGDMEIFLASDVLFSQRVVPLIEQTLSSNSIHGQTTPTGRFVPWIR